MGNELHQAILSTLSLQGDASVVELARACHRKGHVIQYHLNQLLAEGHLRRSFIIDHRALGLQTCNLLFNLPLERQEAAMKFFERRDSVGWIFRNLGDREFEISVNLRSVGELAEIIEGLCTAADTHFQDQSFAFDDNFVIWGYRYFSPEGSKVKPLHFTTPQVFPADELDLRILRASRSTPNFDVASLARHLGALASTIRYRLLRLQKSGVISNPRYILVKSSDNIMQAQVRLQVCLRTTDKEREILDTCQRLPQVTSLTTCIGQWDYKIVLHAQSFADLVEARDRISRALSSNLKHLQFCVRRGWLKATAGV